MKPDPGLDTDSEVAMSYEPDTGWPLILVIVTLLFVLFTVFMFFFFNSS